MDGSSRKIALRDSDSVSIDFPKPFWTRMKRKTFFFLLLPAVPVLLLLAFFVLLTGAKEGETDEPVPGPKSPQVVEDVLSLPREPDADMIRLPPTLTPSLYIITLQVFLPYRKGVDFGARNQSINGEAIINFECHENTDRIFLHFFDILIVNESLRLGDQDSKQHIQVALVAMNTKYQLVEFVTRPALQKGHNYTLLIKYGARLKKNPQDSGFFISSYDHEGETRYHAVSQMQATNARSVFPCFDEPHMKARFQLNIIHPKGTTAISNEDVISVKKKGSWVFSEFDITPIMSTYLIAMVVTDVPFVETRYKDLRIRIWAPKQYLPETAFGLEIVPKGLAFYEDYFNVSNPVSKLDIYLAPNLRVFAMENWGLITIKKEVLLYDPATSTLVEKAQVKTTLLHEIAHSWVGNLVTLKWWNEVWLNEGFACFMSQKAVSSIPDETIDQNHYSIHETLFAIAREDKLPGSTMTHSSQRVASMKDLFNRLTYYKASTIISMYEAMVGEERFKMIMQAFIKENLYKNVDAEDLVNSMERTLRKELHPPLHVKMMPPKEYFYAFAKRPMYPEIMVTRINATTVSLHQILYFYSNHTYSNASQNGLPDWIVPIFYIKNPGDQKIEKMALRGNQTILINDLFLIDPYFNGYYRTYYDSACWVSIIKTLKQNPFLIHRNGRTKLYYEVFPQLIAGRLDVTIALEFLTYVAKENAVGPTAMLANYIDHLRLLFWQEEIAIKLKRFIRSLIDPLFDAVIAIPHGRTLDETKKHVITLACSWGYKRCHEYVKAEFHAAISNCQNSTLSDPSCNSIIPGVRPAVYSMALLFGGDYEFETLFKFRQKETSRNEKKHISHGLTGSSNAKHIKKVLDFEANETIPNEGTCSQYYHNNNLQALQEYLRANLFPPKLLQYGVGIRCIMAIYKISPSDENLKMLEQFEARNQNNTAFKPFIMKESKAGRLVFAKQREVNRQQLHSITKFLNEYNYP